MALTTVDTKIIATYTPTDFNMATTILGASTNMNDNIIITTANNKCFIAFNIWFDTNIV